MILCFWEPQLKWMDMENPTNLNPHGHSTSCPMATSTAWREWTVMQPLEVERTSVSAALVDLVAWVNHLLFKKTDMGSVKRSTRGWYIDTWHIHFSDIRTWPVSVDWKILISDSIKSYQVRTLGRKHVATAPLGIGMDFWDQSRPHRNGHWFAAFNG